MASIMVPSSKPSTRILPPSQTGKQGKLKETHDAGTQAASVGRGLREICKQGRSDRSHGQTIENTAEVEEPRMRRRLQTGCLAMR